MDSTLSYILKRDGDDRHGKESDYCGPLHRSGDCNYINCSYTVDHYHCQICGCGAVEASQALYHIRTSPSCQSTSTLHANAYNAFYGGLASQNSLSGYSGYQLDSFQWHPTVPDKMSICGPQLSPCFNASNNSRVPMDPTVSSPISDVYTKGTAPVKDLAVSTKSSGTTSEPWFYNNQVYKYVEQTSVPQINFLLLDPPEHKDSVVSSDLLYPYSNKVEWRDKEPILCSQQLQSLSSDDSAIFTLQIQDENPNSKQVDLFSMGASSCAQECSKNKDSRCCFLMTQTSTQNSDINNFTTFQSANISDGENSSSGSESDIIVEDTTDQLTISGMPQNQVSLETIKCSLLEEVENVGQKKSESFSSLPVNIAKPSVPVGCGICNDNSPRSSLVQLGYQLPLTSTSHSPVLFKLSQVVNLSETEVVNTVGDICQRCIGLIDAVDSLESQLESARQNILVMFKTVVKPGGSHSQLRLPTFPTEMNQQQSVGTEQHPNIGSNPTSMRQEEHVRPLPLKESADEIGNSNGTESRKIIRESKETAEIFCIHCGTVFASQLELSQHSALHKQCDSKFLCEICGRRLQYRHQYQIDQHLSQHFPINRFSCEKCNKDLKSKRALKEHSKVHTGDRPFSCPNCDRRFAHSSNMRSHHKLCSGDLPYQCDKCKAGFSAFARLERHVAFSHTGLAAGLAAFKCTQCNRTFGKLSDFRSHQRVHSNLRSFACPVCDRSYKSLSNLNQHAKSHRKEKPYNCHICGHSFLRKDTWESHLLSHNNERPFKCTECPKAFWGKENLAMHLKRHAGTHKKTKCPVCEKSFSQKLSVHMRTHTGDRPYRCSKCHKTFSTGSSLNKHTQLKHSFI